MIITTLVDSLYESGGLSSIREELQKNKNIDIEQLNNLYHLIHDRINDRGINIKQEDTRKLRNLICDHIKKNITYNDNTKKYLNTIWFHAAQSGFTNFIDLFLETLANFDPNIKNDNGASALIMVSRHNRYWLISKFCTHKNVEKSIEHKGLNAVDIAWHNDNLEALDKLREYSIVGNHEKKTKKSKWLIFTKNGLLSYPRYTC